ncbi:hypothetical protein K9L67_05510 [Candidatus Woesearchaeota archaeon]|nr:hypothetical protein [Candidatus Woesearchaeota archaeon]MCF7901656.1 hypothetical protein [Candidatus Woesearchaeota archaeon]MCF8013859.1 hypothetical protein [Candidatus Woesearchaeota archaeon]
MLRKKILKLKTGLDAKELENVIKRTETLTMSTIESEIVNKWSYLDSKLTSVPKGVKAYSFEEKYLYMCTKKNEDYLLFAAIVEEKGKLSIFSKAYLFVSPCGRSKLRALDYRAKNSK